MQLALQSHEYDRIAVGMATVFPYRLLDNERFVIHLFILLVPVFWRVLSGSLPSSEGWLCSEVVFRQLDIAACF